MGAQAALFTGAAVFGACLALIVVGGLALAWCERAAVYLMHWSAR